MLEYCIRQSLENTAARGMAVLNPLKVTLTNLPEALDLVHARHPNVDMGERIIPLTFLKFTLTVKTLKKCRLKALSV